METRAFIHGPSDEVSTLSELRRIDQIVCPDDFLGMYAYATQSGLASFELSMGMDFWHRTPTRWLFGIDYGRTQPSAIRSIIDRPNSVVRIADGGWVVNQDGFLPRRDYHLKMALLLRMGAGRFGMVAGSGNFSANGLRNSIEAGVVLNTNRADHDNKCFSSCLALSSELWQLGTPAEDVLPAYEERWLGSFSRRVEVTEEPGRSAGRSEIFWIEAGYVTLNRGPEKPGNQLDLPRGMSRYFGFDPPADMPVNSVIGPLTFVCPDGQQITRNLRLGNNHMEKITLPIPETHGFDIYDGKVVVFRKTGDDFAMYALEAADFETAFGDRLAGVRTMASGRRYGHIA